ncbi:MAG: MlaD family protein [Verrucomicrobiota bacterium]|nr:MlaD family protein [Verrucomicrobiota bacterium]
MKKDLFSNEVNIEVVLGVFLVFVVFGLAYFTFMLSGKKLGEQKHRMEVVFNDVMGLRTKDSVVVRGMPVGEVASLELKPDGVHVFLELVGKRGQGAPVRMKKDYRIAIVTTSILGGRMLTIGEGSRDYGDLPLEMVFNGQDPHDLMSDTAELFSSLRQGLTEKGGVVEGLKEAAADIREISRRLNAGKGTLGKLLSEDDTLYDDLKAGVASLRKVSERLDEGKSTLGKLLADDDQVYQDLKATVSAARKIAERLEKGDGTLGKLLSEDDALYKEFVNVVQEAKAVLDDLRETTPVVTFASILFGAF